MELIKLNINIYNTINIFNKYYNYNFIPINLIQLFCLFHLFKRGRLKARIIS